MLATIQSIEQAFTNRGAEYLKVHCIDGNGKETTKTVFDNLKEKWGLLEEGKTLDFKMVKAGQFWNVEDINPVNLPESKVPVGKTNADVVTDRYLPEHQAEVNKAYPEPETRDAHIQMQVALKEVGELYRGGFLDKNKPVDRKLIVRYKNWIIKALNIEVEYKE